MVGLVFQMESGRTKPANRIAAKRIAEPCRAASTDMPHVGRGRELHRGGNRHQEATAPRFERARRIAIITTTTLRGPLSSCT